MSSLVNQGIGSTAPCNSWIDAGAECSNAWNTCKGKTSCLMPCNAFLRSQPSDPGRKKQTLFWVDNCDRETYSTHQQKNVPSSSNWGIQRHQLPGCVKQNIGQSFGTRYRLNGFAWTCFRAVTNTTAGLVFEWALGGPLLAPPPQGLIIESPQQPTNTNSY